MSQYPALGLRSLGLSEAEADAVLDRVWAAEDPVHELFSWVSERWHELWEAEGPDSPVVAECTAFHGLLSFARSAAAEREREPSSTAA